MADILPKSLLDLIEAFGELPGVGPRTAERYAYGLLRGSEAKADKLSRAVANLKGSIRQCPKTFALINASEELSPLYSDTNRDKTLIAVVEEPLDIVALEKTKQFHGTYHVLGGVISPIDGIGPEQLHVPELLRRIEDDSVKEIILAMNVSVEGESTALFLQRQIREAGIDEVIVTRLARGIPIGVDLEYTDQITLGHALEGRQLF